MDIEKPNCLERISNTIVVSLENSFYRLGLAVNKRPFLFITGALLVTCLCSLGLFNFHLESRPENLWIPQDSHYVKSVKWQRDVFPSDTRMEVAIFEADNILLPSAIQNMYEVSNEIEQITVTNAKGEQKSQSDMCFRVPSLSSEALPMVGYEDEDLRGKDWSISLPVPVYCYMRNILQEQCLQLSILDIWGKDNETIYGLTEETIINDMNTAQVSATYNYPVNFSEFLGGVTKNSSGHIISAKTALHTWFMQINKSEIAEQGSAAGLENKDVDDTLYLWEEQFLSTILNVTNSNDTTVQVYVSSERSFNEISSNTIMGDVLFLILGVSILYVYVTIVIGKFDFVKQRALLSVVGILSVYMSVMITVGLCSAVGLLYGPIHNILPLLLLGLGVDDMFVIVQCWNNLPEKDKMKLLVMEQVGRTLKHGGVAITVTSITDVAAFIIGSSTVLPALQSFCIYSAVGICSLYILQLTFFVAIFSLDQKRMADCRNGLFWFYKHENYTPSRFSEIAFCQPFFDKIYAKILLSKAGKICGLVMTAFLVSFSLWGMFNLKQEFNPIWFIPQSSYLFKFLMTAEEYYPEAGTRATVYMGKLNYSGELPSIHALTMDMMADPDISRVESWYLDLANYTKKANGDDITGKALNETYFNKIMGKFLFSPMGSKHKFGFNFEGNATCGAPIPPIKASKFHYQHRLMNDRNKQIAAMDRVKAMIDQESFSDMVAPISISYSSWETDKVITHELVRNVSLALMAVLIMTLILIANVMAAFLVFICVGFTLIEVMALMTWWGLTIDIVTCINLVLCIGLCVDYSAHIALHFMQSKGTRDQRVHNTLREIAPAVFNGAFSTFLAFILLAFSDSHVFISFFKIFFGVFIFGIFQGLLFLPIILSLIGPAPYPDRSGRNEPTEDEKTELQEQRTLQV